MKRPEPPASCEVSHSDSQVEGARGVGRVSCVLASRLDHVERDRSEEHVLGRVDVRRRLVHKSEAAHALLDARQPVRAGADERRAGERVLAQLEADEGEHRRDSRRGGQHCVDEGRIAKPKRRRVRLERVRVRAQHARPHEEELPHGRLGGRARRRDDTDDGDTHGARGGGWREGRELVLRLEDVAAAAVPREEGAVDVHRLACGLPVERSDATAALPRLERRVVLRVESESPRVHASDALGVVLDGRRRLSRADQLVVVVRLPVAVANIETRVLA
mmetsp:Transcript_42477/g.140769  ORF Transcript_42477/g.140769 Transcript_42477/m.140769 type:complete len:276 (+) Transcript_42477:179-1006(+)